MSVVTTGSAVLFDLYPKESRDELFGRDVEVDYDALIRRYSQGGWVVIALVGLKVF